MEKKVKREFITFWTTGEYMTKILRDFWEEGSCVHAFKTAEEGLGMTKEQALQLFTGKIKLIGNTKEGDHCLHSADDNYEGKYLDRMFDFHKNHYIDLYIGYIGFDTRQRNSMIRALDNGDGLGISAAEMNMKHGIAIEKRKLNYLKELLFLSEMSDNTIDEVYEELFIQIRKTEDEQNKVITEKLIVDDTMKSQRELVNDFVKKQHRMENAPITIGHAGSSNFGWINKKGIFYECEYMGHIGLAQKLFDDKLATGPDEKDLEKAGWLKLSDNKFYSFAKTELTHKQKDFLMEHQMENNMRPIDFNGSDYKTVDEIEEERIRFFT